MRVFTKKIILLIALCISYNLGAQGSSIEGDGRFYSRDDDSLSFIKQQLLTNAFRDIFSKEMKTMGLDGDKFWRSYEGKFQAYFDKVKLGLMTKHGVTKENAKNNKDYQKALRHERLRLKSRYGRISRAIIQHSVKKMSRSPQVPNSRYIKIKAKVNRRELHKIYLTFTGNHTSKHYSSIYISSDFELVETSWSEMGIEVESDFTDVLKNNWKDKLEKILNAKVDSVKFVDASQTSKIKAFSNLSLEALKQVKKESIEQSEAVEEVSVNSETEATKATVAANDYASALWLKINFKIKKTRDNEDTMKRTFEVSGDLFVQDISSQKIIYFTDFNEAQKDYSYEDTRAMSSALANTVYQMPLAPFNAFPRSIDLAKTSLKRVTLEITEYKNMSDLVSLVKFLGNRGVTKQFSPMIKSFNRNQAKIELEYSGGDKEMISMLKSLSGMMIDDDSQILFPDGDKPFEIVVKRSDREEEFQTGENSLPKVNDNKISS